MMQSCKLRPLWSAVAILVLVDTRISADEENRIANDRQATRCFRCFPYSPGGECATMELLCEGSRPRCGTTTTSPDFKSVFTCTEEMKQPCSLIYSAPAQYKITCSCMGAWCNSRFSNHLMKNITNFAAINTKKEGDLINYYLDFTNQTHLNNEELITNMFNMTLHQLWHPDYRAWSDQDNTGNGTNNTERKLDLAKKVGVESLPNPEALKEALVTEPSDDDEDEDEGSGEGEKRPPSAVPADPAAPSSFLPASANSAPKSFLNFILPAYTIYMFT